MPRNIGARRSGNLFTLEAFGPEVFEGESPVLEAFIAEAHAQIPGGRAQAEGDSSLLRGSALVCLATGL